MTPRAIVARAKEQGLDIIAICDHNAAENAQAVVRAARSKNLAVIPGMEITASEQVHVIGLFRCVEEAMEVQVAVWGHLVGNDWSESHSAQLRVDEAGGIIGTCNRTLDGVTDLSLTSAVSLIHQWGGCAIAAHVDADRFSMLSHFGAIPTHLALDALEHSPKISRREARQRFCTDHDREVICASDAHSLADIGKGTVTLQMAAPTVDEIKRALHGEDGRCVVE
jgi:PHP family Zn ribbon phosphoesterase